MRLARNAVGPQYLQWISSKPNIFLPQKGSSRVATTMFWIVPETRLMLESKIQEGESIGELIHIDFAFQHSIVFSTFISL